MGSATLFLIYFKIDPAKIGGILALVNIVSTVLQPFISQVIIKKRKIPLITVLKTMTAGLGVILLAGVLFRICRSLLISWVGFSSFHAIISQCAGI